MKPSGRGMLRHVVCLVLLCSGCCLAVSPDSADTGSSTGNVSNSVWCTDVMNPMMDYVLSSNLLRSIILSEPVPSEGLGMLGFTISELQVSGMERLERHGSLYTVVRFGNTAVVQGAVRAPEVSASFLAQFSILKPHQVQIVTRGTVVRFGFHVKLQSGEKATLMRLDVSDLGRVEVVSQGRLSALIRQTMKSRLTRSRIARKIGSQIRSMVKQMLRQFPML